MASVIQQRMNLERPFESFEFGLLKHDKTLRDSTRIKRIQRILELKAMVGRHRQDQPHQLIEHFLENLGIKLIARISHGGSGERIQL